jgi:hypothetical protein
VTREERSAVIEGANTDLAEVPPLIANDRHRHGTAEG